MPSSILIFSVSPLIVSSGQAITLKSQSLADGMVVYQISDLAPVTFSDGTKRIEKLLVNRKDTTNTSLLGPPCLVRIFAFLEGESEKKYRTVKITA